MSEPWMDADAKACWELAIAYKRERLRIVLLLRARILQLDPGMV